MLKTIFNIFVVTEEQLTKKSITRLRVASCLSLFFIPAVAILQESNVTGFMLMALGVFTFIALISFGYVAMSRATNRLWVPNKYLDEAEIQRKQISAYQTYTSLIFAAFIVLVLFLLDHSLFHSFALNVNVEKALYYIMTGLISSMITLQTFFAAKLMQPLDVDNEAGAFANSGADKWYKYAACAFVLAFLILPLMLGPFGEHLIEGFKGVN